jgi:hypothetical protein
MTFIKRIQLAALSSTIILFLFATSLSAQIQEPDIKEASFEIISLQESYKSGIGIDVNMNNFGFGLGIEYRRVIAPQAEGTISFRINGLRDASEQTFTDIFFGQQIVPNKFQRAFAFPLMIGIRQRVFSGIVQENYRFFVGATAGPVASFSIPYFDDINNSGFRESIPPVFNEPINDIFSGWSDGEWHFGGAGELKIGVDIGTNFSRLGSIEFGYLFYFFPNGIQLMSPNRPVMVENLAPGQFPFQHTNPNDPINSIIFEDFFSPQRFFGSPQITFTFGWLR